MAKTTTNSLSPILERILFPSKSKIFSFSESLARSGVFSSANSIISTAANRDILLEYSAIPSLRYFSFSFPTVTIFIFMLLFYHNRILFTSYSQMKKVKNTINSQVLISYPQIVKNLNFFKLGLS